MQTYLVSQWRGMDNGHRSFGSGLTETESMRRMDLVSRIFPEYARPKAYALELGSTDVLTITRKPQ
jgi:hypothetical protein